MKSKSGKQGFTIIELLTVMSIIVILMSIMMPSLAAIRRYSKVLKQKGQFHDIGTGLEMFSIDFDGYPDSKGTRTADGSPAWNVDTDTPAKPYCGAMRLCEAMLGQDGFGFHPDSRFAARGTDSTGTIFYYPRPLTTANDNRKDRKHPYIDADKFKKAYVDDLFPDPGVYTGSDPCESVICDVFGKVKGIETNNKLGMPILYYNANTAKLGNDPNIINISGNIYDWRDNHDITGLRPVGVAATEVIPLYEGVTAPTAKTYAEVFYDIIRDKKATAISKPYNDSTYILMSAGWDELYGTKDDIYNFGE